MSNRKALPSPLPFYSNDPAASWVRTFTSFIDESLAALCARQWQRAPISIAQPAPLVAQRRRTR